MAVFLRHASLRMVNTSSIPTLLKRLAKGAAHGSGSTSNAAVVANHAKTLLTFVSKHCPALYKAHVAELVKCVADEKNAILVEVALQALAALGRMDAKLVPADK